MTKLLLLVALCMVAATWWLPWDRLPAKYLGPLCLLLAIGDWCIGVGQWITAIYIVTGALLSVFAVMKKKPVKR
jgi:hypothetical protein